MIKLLIDAPRRSQGQDSCPDPIAGTMPGAVIPRRL